MDDKKLDEYDFNLLNLVEDIRTDLNHKDLPVLIGGVGWYGMEQRK